jgi:hypothetical protein
MAESSTYRAILRLVDRAAGALISRRTLVRSALTGSHSLETRTNA